MENEEYRPISLAGAELLHLRFRGNGKDSEALLKTAGNRDVLLPLDDARMDLTLSGSISISLRGWGDSGIDCEITPRPHQRIDIAKAAICIPYDDEKPEEKQECEEAFRLYEQTGTLNWCVMLRLKLVASKRKGEGFADRSSRQE